jgi:anti-sigma regulatory factor (Ser/Thr protein kinase)
VIPDERLVDHHVAHVSVPARRPRGYPESVMGNSERSFAYPRNPWAVVVELFLSRTAMSPRVARRAVADALQDTFSQDVVDRARVLVSELVTNTLQHGQGAPFLCIEHGPRRVRVEVGDDGPALAGMTSGRFGVRLLEAFADSWGIESTRGDGKKVWFELIEPPS